MQILTLLLSSQPQFLQLQKAQGCLEDLGVFVVFAGHDGNWSRCKCPVSMLRAHFSMSSVHFQGQK